MRHVIFTGGGTGGHVYPGIAVWRTLPEHLQRRTVWVGSRNGMEREIVEHAGIPFFGVSSGKLRRYFDLENVVDLFRVIAGVFQAFRLLAALNAAVVFSKGGFVAVPVVLAARLKRVPVIIHESDGDPGLATRITARWADHICVAYSDMVELFPRRLRDRVVVTGNPVRSAFFGAAAGTGAGPGAPPATATGDGAVHRGAAHGVLPALGLTETTDPVILITGGSLGAQQLNEWVAAIVGELTREAVVIHQTGDHGAHMIPELTGQAVPGRYFGAATFTELFPAVLRRADLVVARAGAGTIWEIAVTGRPALLVPLSTAASRGDQIRNAQRYGAAGAAEVLDRPDADAELFLQRVRQLLHDSDRRAEMGAAALRWAGPNGAERLAAFIVALATEDEETQ
ncbi:MAG: undecaprenyldiphospho-muramoylpentapeptide beta-N-acetylglucosaminyltransferase [Spirochaeta sp.]|jgi:UDP-N-acetylglucosamine--N-acetylmuramyl-(pentapeptide) pyrophosphoryl-undecaprenol N-acetylglucosamine transferase|nr:undecaprenyldiphospho-muramoylpentapeptide beta-N-acetylglucosaminyltransferase [Spirochaeta sp.]